MGCVHPLLDKFVTTEERRRTFLQLAESVSRGNDLTPEARSTLSLLVALIRGDISTDASSPLDYMVSGEFPYRSVRKGPRSPA